MPKYCVTLEETVTYTVDVEAANREEARESAMEAWAQSPQPDNDFCGDGHGVTVTDVEITEGEEPDDDEGEE